MSGVSCFVLTFHTTTLCTRNERVFFISPCNTHRRMQASSLWSAFCISASAAAAVDEGLVGGCIYGNMLVRYLKGRANIIMIKEANICGETIMIDFAGAPFWKVVAINLLFLFYGTYANKRLTYLRNHIEKDNCCGTTLN